MTTDYKKTRFLTFHTNYGIFCSYFQNSFSIAIKGKKPALVQNRKKYLS